MANRVGIELLPYVCRIVEIREKTPLFGRSRSGIGHTRVRTFGEIPYSQSSPGKLTADLREVLKGHGTGARTARVAIWGLRSTHQGLLLPPAGAGDLLGLARREAKAADGKQAAAAKGSRAEAPKASPFTSDGIIVGEVREGGRREVGYVSADPDDVRARLKPLRDAGFEIEGAVTPALAHAVLVRQRWPMSPDQASAVVAVNTRATALTVVRGSVVLFSRELPWGSETERPAPDVAPFDTSRISAKLVSELKRSLVYVKQSRQIDVTHVLVCGDMPDLRSLTGPLMDELNVEVETLDGLDGLDTAHLPEPVDKFRAKVAALRSALGIAAEPALPVDLQPRAPGVSVRVTRSTQRLLAVVALIACAVVGTVWQATRYLQNDTRARVLSLRQQIASLEPEAQRQAQARRAAAATAVRLAALEAFRSQGPRLALVLDAFRRAPYDLVMNSLGLTSSSAGTWPLSVGGQAKSRTTADAQASFSLFLKSAGASKYLGLPTRSPQINIHIEEAPPKEGAKDSKGSSGESAAPQEIPLRDISPTQRPRDADVLKAERIPARDGNGNIVGYVTKFTIGLTAVERIRGASPARVAAIAEYNRFWNGVTEVNQFGNPSRRSTRSTNTAAVVAQEPPPPPFVGTVLDFALTFEVKK